MPIQRMTIHRYKEDSGRHQSQSQILGTGTRIGRKSGSDGPRGGGPSWEEYRVRVRSGEGKGREEDLIDAPGEALQYNYKKSSRVCYVMYLVPLGSWTLASSIKSQVAKMFERHGEGCASSITSETIYA